MEYIVQFFSAIAISICAGMRAFLPMFVLSLAVRTEYIDSEMLNQGILPILHNDIFFYIMAFMAVFEIIGEKLDSMSGFLDTIYLFFRPVGGAFVAYCFISLPNPLMNFIAALCVSTFITLPIHHYKANSIIKSEGTILKNFNLYLSIGFDLIAVGGSWLCLIMPAITLFAVPMALFTSVYLFRQAIIKVIEQKEVEIALQIQQGIVPESDIGQVERIKKELKLIAAEPKPLKEQEGAPPDLELSLEEEQPADFLTNIPDMGPPREDLQSGEIDFNQLMQSAREKKSKRGKPPGGSANRHRPPEPPGGYRF